MRVDASGNYKLIFTLNPDTEIGPVIEPFIVQLNSNDSLSLTYQKLYGHTMKPFSKAIGEAEKEAIKVCSEYSMDVIARKFCKKEVRPHEFVTRYLDDKLLKESIRPYVEDRIVKCLQILQGKELYLRGKSGNPAHKLLQLEPEEVSVHFHFVKEEESTRYYPTFRCRGEGLTFVNKDVLLVTNQPCFLLMGEVLYHFAEGVEGKKLTPFFNKWNIEIPRNSEPQYFRRFIQPLIEKYTVIAKGFDIYTVERQPRPLLKMELNWQNQAQLSLYFDYGKDKIPAGEPRKTVVKMERNDERYTYYKIIRSAAAEHTIREQLLNTRLETVGEYSYMPPRNELESYTPFNLVEWINSHRLELEQIGVSIMQDGGLSSKYYLGEIKLDFAVKENNDWFDVYAVVCFGNYRIPFVQLKKYILNGIMEYTLPDGSIAILPNEWFTLYKDLLALSSANDEGELKLQKHHYNLVNDIVCNQKAQPEKDFYLSFNDLQKVENEIPVPAQFKDVLRPYQEKGFQWMSFLRKNNFGGCLADDMGLGKTIQTLAVLQYEQEYNISANGHSNGNGNGKPAGQLTLFQDQKTATTAATAGQPPSLIVMPTSLIHNWLFEVKKWAPQLLAINYTGLDRAEKLKRFRSAGLILTTYGTARNDIDILKEYEFNYIILDESQVIKNPLAKVSKAIKQLKGRHRLGLSGTPVENSLIDLWSQMSFLNPGLLGSYKYFRDEFAIPIEKKGDEERKKKLKILIEPFILRRTKEQVAKELPQLTEKIYFSEMSETQKDLYDSTRNFYRKKILENLEEWGEQRAQFFILKGLMQLRLIASHPRMYDQNFDGDSGKFEDITNALESLLSEKHRVLVFSQFVRHLELIGAWLQKKQIPYSLLTGQTRKREEVIKGFKENEGRQVFLISLKAGGVGLNLTEADYVFLCDPWWNPAAEQQAINRAHRIGQEKSVFAYKFISKDTVEEKILTLQERKLQLSADIIQARQASDKLITREDIDMLFS